MEIESSEKPPNLKRKPDVDVESLMPNAERKKTISNEKAKSIGNSSSPKSGKSNFSEKTAPNKKEEKIKVIPAENTKSVRTEITENITKKKKIQEGQKKVAEVPKNHPEILKAHDNITKINTIDNEFIKSPTQMPEATKITIMPTKIIEEPPIRTIEEIKVASNNDEKTKMQENNKFPEESGKIYISRQRCD